MRPKPSSAKKPAEQVVKDIRRASVASTSAMRLFTIGGTASGRCSRVTFVDSGCAKSALGLLRQNFKCLALGAKLPLPPILNESLLSDNARSTA